MTLPHTQLLAAQPHADHGAVRAASPSAHPPYWMVLPFAALLLAIAVLPLIPRVSKWWDSNLHKLIVSVVLGGGTLLGLNQTSRPAWAGTVANDGFQRVRFESRLALPNMTVRGMTYF